MVASAVEGVDLFKIACRSISGWIPSLKTGTASHITMGHGKTIWEVVGGERK